MSSQGISLQGTDNLQDLLDRPDLTIGKRDLFFLGYLFGLLELIPPFAPIPANSFTGASIRPGTGYEYVLACVGPITKDLVKKRIAGIKDKFSVAQDLNAPDYFAGYYCAMLEWGESPYPLCSSRHGGIAQKQPLMMSRKQVEDGFCEAITETGSFGSMPPGVIPTPIFPESVYERLCIKCGEGHGNGIETGTLMDDRRIHWECDTCGWVCSEKPVWE